MSEKITISEAIAGYLGTVRLARSENTARTYANALNFFTQVLDVRNISPDETPIMEISEDALAWTITALKIYAPTTERLYLAALTGFYKYLVAERLAEINLPRLELLIRQRARRPGQRLPQFPREDIDSIIKAVESYAQLLPEEEKERLRALRDRAFIITLADTGLRVHEICELRRGDVDWNEGRAIIIGKGDKQALIRFSSRSMRSLKDYLSARQKLDGSSGRPLPSLPLFARHDKGAGKKVKPISTATGRNIVRDRVRQILGEEAVGKITPHSFRHYFVTTVLRATGNLKMAQELARHSNIAVTQRYAHLSDDELDQGYYEIFDKK
ncbi:MAG: tyrosine-type recombinase/integrase [Anaerolineae bacterium]|jgi:site-specific recombinase XerD|nr:tyrosine-type recombinase/integrase [Anaerolineae bacterium]MBT3712987.1 tyrosine-type recombinase/integrase [Anaerolineae bacterium]MBT4311481.1 tyrosine-type recombinase/integrase [Anaerolineae bacterium]MBT4458661.1 tyrosine-type recombinase/integrase [Anaerolineae bacterium]MBT6062967.1 tyrosine-type recombinase/integrase [Anaerolineae bacterium]